MMEVQFEGERDTTDLTPMRKAKEGGLVGLLLRTKLAKTRKQALSILLGVGILLIVLTAVIYFVGVRRPSYKMTPAERAKADAYFHAIENGGNPAQLTP